MTDHKALALAFLLPLAFAAALPAKAQEGLRGPQMMFEEIDLNGDGHITQDEMTDRGAARFAAADADGDGTLTRAELLAAATAQAEARIDRMLERVDTDGDRAISETEMTAMAEDRAERRDGRMVRRMFERMDSDEDGAISAAEFEDAAGRMFERRGEHGGERSEHGWFGHRG